MADRHTNTGELTSRQEMILKLIVGEYIVTASPVASETLVKNAGLRVSSATVRNEMTVLEDKGYIYQTHTSGGRVPSDKGYRYFVERLMEETQLTEQEQRMIRHQFHQAEMGMELDGWLNLAAAVLARSAHNFAVVSVPIPDVQTKLKHVQLVSVQDFVVLLIVVMQEGLLRQQLFTMSEPTTQEMLDPVASRFNAQFVNMTARQIASKPLEVNALERQMRDGMVRIMQQVDERQNEQVYYEGLANILEKQEFAKVERMRQMIETLEQKQILSSLTRLGTHSLTDDGVQVIIGAESQLESIRDCSIIITRYGIAGTASGVLGVLGPTRMQYSRAISVVRYLASTMNELLNDLYGYGRSSLMSDDQGRKPR